MVLRGAERGASIALEAQARRCRFAKPHAFVFSLERYSDPSPTLTPTSKTGSQDQDGLADATVEDLSHALVCTSDPASALRWDIAGIQDDSARGSFTSTTTCYMSQTSIPCKCDQGHDNLQRI